MKIRVACCLIACLAACLTVAQQSKNQGCTIAGVKVPVNVLTPHVMLGFWEESAARDVNDFNKQLNPMCKCVRKKYKGTYKMNCVTCSCEKNGWSRCKTTVCDVVICSAGLVQKKPPNQCCFTCGPSEQPEDLEPRS